jgi:hypothetical protein
MAIAIVALIILVGLGGTLAEAQGPTTLTGVISTVWGDPIPNSGQPVQLVGFLNTANGSFQLDVPSNWMYPRTSWRPSRAKWCG